MNLPSIQTRFIASAGATNALILIDPPLLSTFHEVPTSFPTPVLVARYWAKGPQLMD